MVQSCFANTRTHCQLPASCAQYHGEWDRVSIYRLNPVLQETLIQDLANRQESTQPGRLVVAYIACEQMLAQTHSDIQVTADIRYRLPAIYEKDLYLCHTLPGESISDLPDCLI